MILHLHIFFFETAGGGFICAVDVDVGVAAPRCPEMELRSAPSISLELPHWRGLKPVLIRRLFLPLELVTMFP